MLSPRVFFRLRAASEKRAAGSSRVRLRVACVMFLLATMAAQAGDTSTRSKFTGSYQSDLSKAIPSISLSLGDDGTATVTEDLGNGAAAYFGHWVDSGNQVSITFDAEEGKPSHPPMIFQPCHEGLQAVTWNRAEWGKFTPPPMKKGVKIKQAYWFTTVR